MKARSGNAPNITLRVSVADHPLRFGEESVEKMVEWTLENHPPTVNGFILEIGSGNGTLLFALLEAGYSPSRLSGIDYSPDALTLASSIAKTRAGGDSITFSACDFLQGEPLLLPHMTQGQSSGVWDLLLDKGTYDAIALGQKDEQGKSPAARYPERVARLLKPGGFFLITCASLPIFNF